jgi:Uma2 family endonuclease
MKSETLVPLADYLATTYRPDVDYVDGKIVERNVGEFDHSNWQRGFVIWFGVRKQLKLTAFPELRVQVKPDRFRVPDICVFDGQRPPQGYLTDPPRICIEILSPEDRIHDIESRVDDYLDMGVPHVWVIDPESRRAWIHTAASRTEVRDGVLRAGDLAVPLHEIASEG